MDAGLLPLVLLSRMCRRSSPRAEPAHEEERHAKAADLARSVLAERSWEQRLRKLEEPQFQSTDLLALFLQASEAQQLTAPGQALELAGLAYELALQLGEKGKAARPRAALLAINTRRLVGGPRGVRHQKGMFAQAEKHFGLEDRARASFSRVGALVRWEQGATDEAAELLRHAGQVFRQAGDEEEAGTCAALLGLLGVEEGNLTEALPSLYRGWSLMSWSLQPWIALRTGLALVQCLAREGKAKAAETALAEMKKLYPPSAGPAEMLRISWREAMAHASLGRDEKAESMLKPVQQKLLEEGSFAEAALVRVDRFGIQAEAGRAEPLGTLAAELTDFLTRDPGSPRFLPIDPRCMEPASKVPSALAEHVRLFGADLILALRRCGWRIRPLPFAEGGLS